MKSNHGFIERLRKNLYNHYESKNNKQSEALLSRNASDCLLLKYVISCFLNIYFYFDLTFYLSPLPTKLFALSLEQF